MLKMNRVRLFSRSLPKAAVRKSDKADRQLPQLYTFFMNGSAALFESHTSRKCKCKCYTSTQDFTYLPACVVDLWPVGLWQLVNWTVGSMGFSNEKSLFVVWSFRILSNVFLMFLILWPLKHLLAPDDVEFASEN